MSLFDAALRTGLDIDSEAFASTEVRVACCRGAFYGGLISDRSSQVARVQFAGEKLALHNLELDEAASLTLYTMECELYPTLNGLLRNRNRKELIPFFPYVLPTLRISQCKHPDDAATRCLRATQLP
jgi:hypothetical protein